MLEVTGADKRFGTQQAVSKLAFTVRPGEIMGLIGQNGAGKTTTFRMILGFLTPDAGTITWEQAPIKAMNRDLIGYLPEERGLYPKMTIEDQVTFFGQLHGMTRQAVMSQLDEWMARFEVKGKRTDKIKDLSKGNQQKVQLIAALIFNPQLVILDEPFSGLDPVNAELLKIGVRQLRDNGAAVIFSSHDMSNVEALSDHLVMLKDGAAVLSGTVEAIKASYGRTRVVLEQPGVSQAELERIQGVLAVRQDGPRFVLQLRDEAVGRNVFDVVSHGEYIPEFSQQAPSLDEIFRLQVEGPHE